MEHICLFIFQISCLIILSLVMKYRWLWHFYLSNILSHYLVLMASLNPSSSLIYSTFQHKEEDIGHEIQMLSVSSQMFLQHIVMITWWNLKSWMSISIGSFGFCLINGLTYKKENSTKRIFFDFLHPLMLFIPCSWKHISASLVARLEMFCSFWELVIIRT